MTSSPSRAPDQLTLESWLHSKPDEDYQLQLDPDDIGAELVAILSKGLYTDPFDCIREYVQNGVDGDATSVRIKITANSIVVSDDGVGMDFATLVRSRQFGLSLKSIVEDVGFRGIGIYSGFDLCERLIITSKQAGTAEQNILTFDFAGMRKALRGSRPGIGTEPRPSLIELLSGFTYFRRDTSVGPIDGSYTIVDLQNMSAEHIDTLSDRERMRRYLLNTVPIDWVPSFEHRDAINTALRGEMHGYNPIKVILEAPDGLPPTVIEREPVSGLYPPTFETLKDERGNKIALVWSGLNTRRSRLFEKDESEFNAPWREDYEGFVFKIKGFTIGSRTRLQSMFKQPPLYRWYTGEIYVLDPDVVPNAGRDWFETSDATDRLMTRVRAALVQLEKRASDIQVEGRADDTVNKVVSEIAGLEANWIEATTIGQRLEVVTQLSRLEDQLKAQRAKASTEIKKLVPDFDRRAKRIKDEFNSESGKLVPTRDAGKATGTKARRPSSDASTPLPHIPTLAEISARAGVATNDGDDLAKVVAAVDASVDEVLGSNRDLRSTLMRSIESRLTGGES